MHRLTAPPSAGLNPPDAGALVVGQRAKDYPAYHFDPSVIDLRRERAVFPGELLKNVAQIPKERSFKRPDSGKSITDAI